MNGGRIQHEDTSYWSVCVGLVVVILVGTGVYFYSSSRANSKKSTPYDYNKPVPSDADLRARLKEEQYKVTRQNGTEPAFQNEYWNNQRAGIYVDVITGDPLFSSLDKFDGGNGRVNFSKPLDKRLVVERPDHSQGLERTEIRAARSDSHLGHLFRDWPPPTNGERYCVNSAALKFIPVEEMETDGYAQWRPLFPPTTGTDQKTGTK